MADKPPDIPAGQPPDLPPSWWQRAKTWATTPLAPGLEDWAVERLTAPLRGGGKEAADVFLRGSTSPLNLGMTAATAGLGGAAARAGFRLLKGGAAPAAKLTLTAPEVAEGLRLQARGLPSEEILKHLTAAKELAAKLGTPSSTEVSAAVNARNLSGRWGNEAGAISSGMLTAIPKAINSLRVTGMLSGLALPKSMLGNAAAVRDAALELGSIKPITEALRVPTNTANAMTAFKHGGNPANIAGLGRINIPGRLMGAFDTATQQALERAGAPRELAQELLLQSPHPLGHGALQQALSTPLGRYILPFQKIPVNQFSQGLLRLSGQKGALPATMAVGHMAGGAAAGSVTDDPRLLGLGTAASGVYGVPFMLGAALTAGPKAIRGLSPLPEYSFQDFFNPFRPINRPAFIPAFLEP